MAAALVVAVIIIGVAWFALTRRTAPPEPRSDHAETTHPAVAPHAATTTHARGSESTITLAPLPAVFDRTETVKSHSEKGKTYQVNLGQLTCTCEDYAKRRASMPVLDLRRVCKHLGRSLEASGALSHFDEVAQALILPAKAIHNRVIKHGVSADRFVVLPDGSDRIVLGLRADSPWVDVVTKRGASARIKKYKRYSYNVEERRWAYESSPFSDGAIRQLIHSHVHT